MIDKWIDRFKREALPIITRDLQPVSVLLFGSRITGGAGEESDLDVILISANFAGIPFVKRMAGVLKITRFPKHVDYLCYTPEEFQRIKETSSIIAQVLEQGVEVVA